MKQVVELKSLPRKTNCAQKNTTPKKGKLRVTRFKNVLTTLGVHTWRAAGFSANSEHGLIRSSLLVQSGCSRGELEVRSQKVCGPNVAYCGATTMDTE
jgi:hypothetical protein